VNKRRMFCGFAEEQKRGKVTRWAGIEKIVVGGDQWTRFNAKFTGDVTGKNRDWSQGKQYGQQTCKRWEVKERE